MQHDGSYTDGLAQDNPPTQAGSDFDLYQQQRLLESQRARVQAATDRLARQNDPALREGLAAELRQQEGLFRGLAEGVDRLRERARKEFELARTRAYLSEIRAERDRSVRGEERAALIAKVRANLRRSD